MTPLASDSRESERERQWNIPSSTNTSAGPGPNESNNLSTPNVSSRSRARAGPSLILMDCVSIRPARDIATPADRVPGSTAIIIPRSCHIFGVLSSPTAFSIQYPELPHPQFCIIARQPRKANVLGGHLHMYLNQVMVGRAQSRPFGPVATAKDV